MSTLNAPTVLDTAYSGTAPLAVVHGSTALAAAAIADRVRLNKVFAGSKVYASKLITGALGASAKLSLGFEYAGGEAGGSDTAFLPATDCSAAGSHESAAAPVTLKYDAYIVAVVSGAAATGQVDSVVTFEFKGQ